jgi:hypothetical protein
MDDRLEVTMVNKTRMVLAAVMIIGGACAAQAAGSDKDEGVGGFRIGPLGQVFAPRSANQQWLHDQKYGFTYGGPVYGFAPEQPRMWYYEGDRY